MGRSPHEAQNYCKCSVTISLSFLVLSLAHILRTACPTLFPGFSLIHWIIEKRIPGKHLLLLHWLGQSLWLCAAAAAAKSLQSCPTLCDPINCSPSGSPIPGILQARTLEWVAISFSNAWKWKVKVKSLSHVRLIATPWTAAYQTPDSMGFSRQEYWSGVPLPLTVWITINCGKFWKRWEY